MRVTSKLMVLGALVLGIVLPSTASASSPVVTHLFFDGKQVVNTDTGFTNTSTVSYGNNVSHGPVVGKSQLKCVFLTDSKARCSAFIRIYKAGTTTVDRSVFITDEIINFNAPAFIITGGTGAWGAAESGMVIAHNVNDTATNVELVLVF
jgi:hypothetical protein